MRYAANAKTYIITWYSVDISASCWVFRNSVISSPCLGDIQLSCSLHDDHTSWLMDLVADLTVSYLGSIDISFDVLEMVRISLPRNPNQRSDRVSSLCNRLAKPSSVTWLTQHLLSAVQPAWARKVGWTGSWTHGSIHNPPGLNQTYRGSTYILSPTRLSPYICLECYVLPLLRQFGLVAIMPIAFNWDAGRAKWGQHCSSAGRCIVELRKDNHEDHVSCICKSGTLLDVCSGKVMPIVARLFLRARKVLTHGTALEPCAPVDARQKE
jgi:hypothetical protein